MTRNNHDIFQLQRNSLRSLHGSEEIEDKITLNTSKEKINNYFLTTFRHQTYFHILTYIKWKFSAIFKFKKS